MRPKMPIQSQSVLLNEYNWPIWPKHKHIMKHANVIIKDLIAALKRLPVLCEEILLKIVFPTLEINAKNANRM